MLNDVKLDDLKSAHEHITKHPEQGIVSYGINLHWEKGVRGTASTLDMQVGDEIIPRYFSWTVDEPPQLLGDSKGPTPQEYLMSGVGACIMVGFAVNASAKGVEIRSLDVEVKGSLDLAGFMNLRDDAQVKMQGMQYRIIVDTDAPDDVVSKIEKAAVEFSPNAMTVKTGIPVTGTTVRA